MSVEENKTIIRRLFEEAFNQGNLATVDELFTFDFVDHSTPSQIPGPKGVKEYFSMVHAGFPDVSVTIDDLIAEGDKVVVRTTWRGTQQSSHEDKDPTNTQVTRTL
ncbi:MAG: ester cyclase, partial [Chloroflexi bacterium]|nr:ester cyclase [Chloroflexota bacterium]